MENTNQQQMYEEAYMDQLEGAIVKIAKPSGGFVGSWLFVLTLLAIVAVVGFGLSFFVTLYLK